MVQNDLTGTHALKILVRGGGDLASGAVIRMHRIGWQVLVTELAQPMAVRRLVSFAQAVYDGRIQIEDVSARLAGSPAEVAKIIGDRQVAVLVDPAAGSQKDFQPEVIVDARMRKTAPEQTHLEDFPFQVGLGPGFIAGENCHAVIETNRGPFLGRVIWDGAAQADTGTPERVKGYEGERVLRAPVDGQIQALKAIGTFLQAGEPVVKVGERLVPSPFDGILRGLLPDGLQVEAGLKIGDVDPRNDPRLCKLVSDKALAVGGGVIEAVLVWLYRREREK